MACTVPLRITSQCNDFGLVRLQWPAAASNHPSERSKRQARMLKAEAEDNLAKKEPRLRGRMRAGRLAMIRGQIGDLPAVGLDTGPATAAIHRLSYIARYRSPALPRSPTGRPFAVAF